MNESEQSEAAAAFFFFYFNLTSSVYHFFPAFMDLLRVVLILLNLESDASLLWESTILL